MTKFIETFNIRYVVCTYFIFFYENALTQFQQYEYKLVFSATPVNNMITYYKLFENITYNEVKLNSINPHELITTF